MQPSTQKKVYKLWSGNQMFCFKALCTGGPISDIPVGICVQVFQIGAGLFYYIAVAKFTWQNISPWLPISFTQSYSLMLLSYFMTSCSDPGIIPPRKYFEAAYPEAFADGTNKTYYLEKHDLNHERVYCHTCQIYRPPRASHCGDCGCCVEILDHHCIFVGNCVGRRNYQWFIMYLIFVTMSLMLFMFQSMSYMTESHNQSLNQRTSNTSEEYKAFTIIGIVFFVGIALFLLFVQGLCIFTCVVKSKGKTTREYLKNVDVDNYDYEAEDEKENDSFYKMSPTIVNYRYVQNTQQVNMIQNWSWVNDDEEKRLYDRKNKANSYENYLTRDNLEQKQSQGSFNYEYR